MTTAIITSYDDSLDEWEVQLSDGRTLLVEEDSGLGGRYFWVDDNKEEPFEFEDGEEEEVVEAAVFNFCDRVRVLYQQHGVFELERRLQNQAMEEMKQATPELDTESSASVQHFIDTGQYLRFGEAISA
jgi:hypothetical protein